MSDSEEDEAQDTKLKLLLVGDGGCGKVMLLSFLNAMIGWFNK